MQIFAFGHRKEVGKDQFVKFAIELLRKKHGKLNIQRMGFADKLKATCHLLYAWAGHRDPSYYEHNEGSKNDILLPLGKSVRQLWIEVGNHMRTYDQEVWRNAVIKQASCDILFITDLRYPDEVLSVKKEGGIVVKINRPDKPNTDDVADIGLKDFEGWDQVIENDGTLQDFYSKAEKWVEQCQVSLPIFS